MTWERCRTGAASAAPVLRSWGAAGAGIVAGIALLAVLVLVVAAAEPAIAAFPGASGRIAFQRGGEIWSVRAGGGDERRLVDGFDPAWSSDGTELAFSKLAGCSTCVAIAVVGASGEGERRVTDGTQYDVMPAWSPDGGRIAFVSARSQSLEIWTVNADGSDLAQLTNDLQGDLQPAWSPDGAKIAFAGGPIRGNPEIWVINRDGSGTQRLTFDDNGSRTLDFGPAWSPNGRQIAWLSERSGAWEVWKMNADGSAPAQLTTGGTPSGCAAGPCIVPDHFPAWSPDGTKIAFVREQEGLPRIFVMNANGTGAHAVTDDVGENPDWQPAVDLSVAIRARPAKPRGGRRRPFVVSIVVRNASTLRATAVTVTGTVRGTATIRAVKPGRGSCRGTERFACRLGDLGPGEARSVVLNVRPRGAAKASISAAAASHEADSEIANNSARARFGVH